MSLVVVSDELLGLLGYSGPWLPDVEPSLTRKFDKQVTT
jgi:hypothetical protein